MMLFHRVRFSNHHKKQPALRFLKVRAAFYIKRSSENRFQTTFDIQFRWIYNPNYGCLPLNEHIALCQKTITIAAAMMMIPYGIIPLPFSYTARPPGKSVRAVLATV